MKNLATERGRSYWLTSPYLVLFTVGWAVASALLTYHGYGVALRYGMCASLCVLGFLALRTYNGMSPSRYESTDLLEAQRNKAVASITLGLSILANTYIGHVPQDHHLGGALAYGLLGYTVAAFNASNIIIVRSGRRGHVLLVLRFWRWIPAALSASYRRRIRESWRPGESLPKDESGHRTD